MKKDLAPIEAPKTTTKAALINMVSLCLIDQHTHQRKGVGGDTRTNNANELKAAMKETWVTSTPTDPQDDHLQAIRC